MILSLYAVMPIRTLPGFETAANNPINSFADSSGSFVFIDPLQSTTNMMSRPDAGFSAKEKSAGKQAVIIAKMITKQSL
jgi:hypothetical protein